MANFNYTHSQLGATVWSPSENADLMLPNKSTVGQTDTEALRRILGKIGIEGSHTKPRLELVADYAAMLKRVAQNGARDAIDAWLATYKD